MNAEWNGSMKIILRKRKHFMRFIFTLLFATVVHLTTPAQGLLDQFTNNSNDDTYNYVPNPGFEDVLKTPCRWNQRGIEYMQMHFTDWTSPTETTPDLLTSRVSPDCWAHPQKHSPGRQRPRNGDNMMGIKVQGTGGSPTFWHEYLMVKLDSTIYAGQRYYAEMWVLRSERSARASNNLGMLFSDTMIRTNNRLPLYFTPHVNVDKPVETRGNRWKKINGVFEAETDMHYLLIGNFYGDKQTEIVKYPDGERGSYYYIDEILVRDARDGERLSSRPKESIKPEPKKKIVQKASTVETPVTDFELEVGDILELRNIFFEFDKAELLPESKEELDMLVDLMYDFPYMEVEIGGHTDNVGSASYNKKLSEARAKAVVDYLSENSTDSSRMTYKGFGFEQPIATNDTEMGRQLNRRVEFKVVKN